MPRSAWLSLARAGNELNHRLDLHVAVLQLPFVVLFEQHRADQSDDRCLVGEYADNVGASLHFLVQPFQRIRAVDLGPVLLGEVQMRQNVGSLPSMKDASFGHFCRNWSAT